MNKNRVPKLRTAAKAAGYDVHYDNKGHTYSLHGPQHFYGLTLEEAERKISEL